MKKEERKHMTTCGNKNACGEKECTSNLGLSSKMGWVAEGSSLCLDCQEINKYIFFKKKGELDA